MDSNNHELLKLRKRLEIYDFRTKILHFQTMAVRLNSRSRFVLTSKDEFHLNECFCSLEKYSIDNLPCRCRSALDFPDNFFEKRMMAHSKYVLSVHRIKSINSSTQCYKRLDFKKGDESLTDFYQFRVLDFENIHKWYEMYKAKTNVLQFRVKVRELKKKHLIDAVYNAESGEWHLTDCMRSIKWDYGSDTCHCQSAMMNPWKYLKEVYHFVDWGKIFDTICNEKVPVKFT